MHIHVVPLASFDPRTSFSWKGRGRGEGANVVLDELFKYQRHGDKRKPTNSRLDYRFTMMFQLFTEEKGPHGGYTYVGSRLSQKQRLNAKFEKRICFSKIKPQTQRLIFEKVKVRCLVIILSRYVMVLHI